jgi:hypothetical protein
MMDGRIKKTTPHHGVKLKSISTATRKKICFARYPVRTHAKKIRNDRFSFNGQPARYFVPVLYEATIQLDSDNDDWPSCEFHSRYCERELEN